MKKKYIVPTLNVYMLTSQVMLQDISLINGNEKNNSIGDSNLDECFDLA